MLGREQAMASLTRGAAAALQLQALSAASGGARRRNMQ